MRRSLGIPVFLAALVAAGVIAGCGISQPGAAGRPGSEPAADASSAPVKQSQEKLPGKARPPCKGLHPARADVDGDHRADFVYHEYIRGRAALGVCTATGSSDRVPGAGQSELLEIIDVESDGRDEIFYGGTTAAARISSVAVFTHGRIKTVVLRGNGRLILVDGLDPGVDREEEPGAGAIGCEDVTEDGQDELIQVSVVAHDDSWRWTRTAYAIERSMAVEAKRESGERANDPERSDVEEVMDVAASLTRRCHVKAFG